VSFTKNNQIRFMMDASDRFYRTYNIPEADVSVAQWSATSDQGLTVYMSSAYGDVPNIDYQTISCVEENAVGGGNGLLKFEQNDPNPAASLFSHTTSDYNTGWMVGDTKLATLSDTDTTNAVGTNLVTNGDFASNTTGWSSGNVSTLSVSGGQLVITATGAAYPSARQVISVVPNQAYYYSVDIKRGTCNVDVHLEYNDSVGSGWQQLASHNSTTLTTFTGTIVPSGGTIDLRVTIFTNSATTGHTAIADNVVVRLAEKDRSVGGSGYQGKALGVFGTVTKTAVATGAELVGYSGFSTSNYLQQPYNADLQFGTGDFSIACWVKAGTANAYRRFISIQDPTGNQNNNDAINIKYAPPSSGFLYAYLGTSEGSIATAAGIPANIWQQVILLRSSGTYYLYLDGTLVSTRASTQSKGSTSHVLRVGGGADGPEPLLDGSIALVRISKTAPTPEQIKKMYNDEKHLFQTNAKATLYGTSDAVTALAYDDDTELLHVGTSAGRSEFQGLRRVNNTTDAVGAAISASNGFIVEE
jgi:trimeric autotransporter adhesin